MLEISKRPTDADLGAWTRKLGECLAMRDPKMNDYGKELIEEVELFRKSDTYRKKRKKKGGLEDADPNARKVRNYEIQSSKFEDLEKSKNSGAGVENKIKPPIFPPDSTGFHRIPEDSTDSVQQSRAEQLKQSNKQEEITTPLNPPTGGDAQTPEEKFEIARTKYPGTKNGHRVEWENFKRKAGKNFHLTASLLFPAIELEISHKAALSSAGAFCPEWPHFRTWINQNRWEQEFSKEALNGNTRNHKLGSRTARLDEDGRTLARKIKEAAGIN